MAKGRVAVEPPRRASKSAAAFRTISEVADDLDVPQHVLRFWETKFSQIKPLKRGGGRRYYRPEDVILLRRIKALLYGDGYTIKGVQKLLRDGGGRDAPTPPSSAPTAASVKAIETADVSLSRATIETAVEELLAVRELLKS